MTLLPRLLSRNGSSVNSRSASILANFNISLSTKGSPILNFGIPDCRAPTTSPSPRRVRSNSAISNPSSQFRNFLSLSIATVLNFSEKTKVQLDQKKESLNTRNFQIRSQIDKYNNELNGINNKKAEITRFLRTIKNHKELHDKIDDPELDVDENCILVLKNCGPKGYPGMAEVGNMRLPQKV